MLCITVVSWPRRVVDGRRLHMQVSILVPTLKKSHLENKLPCLRAVTTSLMACAANLLRRTSLCCHSGDGLVVVVVVMS